MTGSQLARTGDALAAQDALYESPENDGDYRDAEGEW